LFYTSQHSWDDRFDPPYLIFFLLLRPASVSSPSVIAPVFHLFTPNEINHHQLDFSSSLGGLEWSSPLQWD
jgi:hypothetical protein